MKKIISKSRSSICILTFVFVLISASASLSQVTGWVWQNPLPQGEDILRVVFTSLDTGYQCGYWGTIVKTTDRGNSWFSVIENSDYIYGTICFINNNTGIVTGRNYNSPGDSRVLKTTNGGINWRRIVFDSTKGLANISFGDNNTGYGTDFPYVVYKTTNCGESWFTVVSPGNSPGYSYFLNASTGFFTGSGGYIYKTENGGITYMTRNIEGKNIVSIKFLNTLTGYAIATATNISFILRSTDQGLNWVQTDSMYGTSFRNLHFVSSERGYIMSNYSFPQVTSIYLTTNAGINWSGIYSSPTSNNQSFFTGSTYGFMVSYNGRTLRTTNGGFNWFDFVSVTYKNLNKIQFINVNTGFVAGNEGTFLSTSNGGMNWILKRIDTTANYTALYFTDANTGFISGYKGNPPFYTSVLYKTVNGGNNWTLINFNSAYSSLCFRNSLTGYSAGPSGTLYKTTDGGLTWPANMNSESARLYAIFFTSDNTGFVCGAQGKIYKTTNAGLNWISKFGAPQNTVIDIFFANENSGFALSYDPDWSYDRIWRTTDAGENWSLKLQTYDDYRCVHFPAANTGYIAGETGIFLKTTNNGENWFTPSRFTGKYLASVFFTSVDTGYVVGSDGAILKTTNSGVLIPVYNIQSVIAKSYALFQNYPNPFNPITTIKFVLPKSGFVEIIVYDINGREITKLVQQQMNAGSYTADWDATTYASGVYFYKLESGDYIESKKMVLVK
jgi:photosystem II stability/assembly factor-like uncharacterized protein